MYSLRKTPSDLIVMLAWTVLTLIIVIIPSLDNIFIRTIFGIPMVLFIPGYVLIAALFPKKDDLDTIERIALSFGLSIAVVPLIGLVLNFTPFGIRLAPIMLTLYIYNIVLIVIADYRRRILPENDRFSVSFYGMYRTFKTELGAQGSRKDRILTVVLLCSIVLAIGMLIYVIATPKAGERFTEFYILGPDGKADNYPTDLTKDSTTSIIVGIVNHEYEDINYTAQIVLDNITLATRSVSLSHNNTWEQEMIFLPNKEGKNMKLIFKLFKEYNFTAPYRDLHLWVDVADSSIIEIPADTQVAQILPRGKEIAIKLDNRRGFIPFNQKTLPNNAIEVFSGDKVTWINEGVVAVTLASDIPGFEDRLIDYYGRTSYIFTEPGNYYFYFKENKNLNNTIIVKSH